MKNDTTFVALRGPALNSPRNSMFKKKKSLIECVNRQLAKLLSENEVRGKVAISTMQMAVNFTRSLSRRSRKVS